MPTKNIVQTCSLDEMLDYENPDVTYKFSQCFELSDIECNLIFKDMICWMWLCSQAHKFNFKHLFINDDLAIIDEMWHTFILFTEDYSLFCKKYLDYFLHHSPAKKKTAEEFTASNKILVQNIKEKQDLTYEFVYDHLGIEILKRWYLEYPIKYSKEIIHKKRLR